MNDRFEYKVITLKSEQGARAAFGMGADDDEAAMILTREGAQGWELVSVTVYGAMPRAFLKRRK